MILSPIYTSLFADALFAAIIVMTMVTLVFICWHLLVGVGRFVRDIYHDITDDRSAYDRWADSDPNLEHYGKHMSDDDERGHLGGG